MTEALERAKRDVLTEGLGDYVGLWRVVDYIGKYFPDAAAGLARTYVLQCVRELLSGGLMRAGFPTSDGRGFNAWNISVPETVRKIELAWDALNREPDIGDIIWFDLTPAGERFASEWRNEPR